MNGVTVQHKNSSHDHNVHLNLQFISFRLYMESIQFIFWLYMENVCVYHVSSSCLRVSAAFSLTIVLFVEQLCALRLTCASSLRFNQGFCMEWIKYQHNEVIISQKPPPTICILLYIQFFKVGKGWIKHDVVKMNPEPFKIQDLNIVNCVSLTSDLISSSGLPSPQHLRMQMGTCND